MYLLTPLSTISGVHCSYFLERSATFSNYLRCLSTDFLNCLEIKTLANLVLNSQCLEYFNVCTEFRTASTVVSHISLFRKMQRLNLGLLYSIELAMTVRAFNLFQLLGYTIKVYGQKSKNSQNITIVLH